MKKLREVIWLNKIIRILIRLFAYLLPNLIKTKIIPRWRISGEVRLNIAEKISIRYYNKCDDGIVDSIYYNSDGYSEIHELRLFLGFSKKSKVILDIGANTGLYSVTAAVSNRAAIIIAVEPYATNTERLTLNVNLNRLTNIEILQKGVGSDNSNILFSVPVNNQICDVLSADHEFTSSFYKGMVNFKQINIPQITIDSLVEEKNLKQIDLIKIDVENYELEVFKGAKNTLKNYDPIIFCEIFVNQNKINFFQEFLQPLGYNCYLILKEGIVRSERLIHNPDCRNYLFSKKKSDEVFLSYKEMDKILNAL
jgi:FkbM family methyltransferase